MFPIVNYAENNLGYWQVIDVITPNALHCFRGAICTNLKTSSTALIRGIGRYGRQIQDTQEYTQTRQSKA